MEDGKVRFRWKDYAQGGAQKTMALNPVEFIRRFLLHVLPSGFVRIRHYGFLANRMRHDKLALCRATARGQIDARTHGVRSLGRTEGAPRTANSGRAFVPAAV